MLEGAGLRVSLRGTDVPRVIAPRERSVPRCLSNLLMHLSLSLSLLPLASSL
jgi:hypothetical protein